MYKVDPLVDPNQAIELSNRMYKTKNLVTFREEEEEAAMDTSVLSCLDELELQQDKIMARLQQLQLQVSKLAQSRGITLALDSFAPVQVNGKISLAIHADASKPPLSVFLLMQLLRIKGHKVFVTSHVHSSVTGALNAKTLKLCALLDNGELQRGDCDILVSIIWKQDLAEKCAIVANGSFSSHPLLGESMLVRYLLAVLDEASFRASSVNSFIDLVDFSLMHGTQKERQKSLNVLDQLLAKSKSTPGGWICELFLWSAIHTSDCTKNLPSAVKKLIDTCNRQAAYESVKKCL